MKRPKCKKCGRELSRTKGSAESAKMTCCDPHYRCKYCKKVTNYQLNKEDYYDWYMSVKAHF